MAMSRGERVRLKSRVIETLGSNDWTLDRTNVLLKEFGLEPIDGDRFGPSLPDVIANVTDELLIELYSVVTGVELDEVEADVAAADDGNWKDGYFRLFLSHSAVHKKFVGDIAGDLEVMGIHGFVAHDTMEVSRPWQTQIEKALRTMHAFVAIVHPEFNQSAWCHEEVGWALGRRVPRYVIRMGADPAAFIGREQWPSWTGRSASEVAGVVATWITGLAGHGTAVFDRLVAALKDAPSFVDAGATAGLIAALGTLSDEQFRRIEEVWYTNDQLYGGVLPTRAMQRVYAANGRAWPPPKPAPPADEEPF